MLPKRGDPRRAFRSVAYGGSYTQALREVAEGRADVATVSDYTLEGPRADVYLPAAERAGLRVLARTPGVPTHLVAVRRGLDAETRARVRDEPALLADVYGASTFVAADGRNHVAAAVRAIEYTGIPIEGLAR